MSKYLGASKLNYIEMKRYNVNFSFNRSVLINPDGSGYIINMTTDNEFAYGLASTNLFLQMYEGYLPLFMFYSSDLLLANYNRCLALP